LKAKCFNAALLAGFISRQTKGGKILEGTDGWIPCNNPANGNCFGIMHINDLSKFMSLVKLADKIKFSSNSDY